MQHTGEENKALYHAHDERGQEVLQQLDGTCQVVGHLLLRHAAEVFDGSACIVLSVVVQPQCRGQGIGAKLMRAAEELGRQHEAGYGFVYLQARDGVAPFYAKLGYTPTRAVSRGAVLKQVEPERLSALEAMLAKRNKVEETDDQGNFMRKRLREFNPLQELDADAQRSRVEELLGSDQGWAGVLLPVPWERQIGPSCGLSVLRMANGFVHALDDVGVSLLDVARERGVSTDGDMFDALALADLGRDVVGLDVQELDLSRDPDAVAADITRAVCAGNPVIIAYDRGGAYEPVCDDGSHAHWCIITGVAWPCEPAQAGFTTTLASPPTPPAEALQVVFQHGVSVRPSVCTVVALLASNAQLHGATIEAARAAVAGVDPDSPQAKTLPAINLAGVALVVKSS